LEDDRLIYFAFWMGTAAAQVCAPKAAPERIRVLASHSLKLIKSNRQQHSAESNPDRGDR
jgi:hypothetical protein